MLSPDAYWRARTIVKNKEVLPNVITSSRMRHFKVLQRSGKWTDVWRVTRQGGVIEWNCNAVDKFNKWGCVMYTGDRTKPFCSHTKACELYMRGAL